jgi:hypothetical protein
MDKTQSLAKTTACDSNQGFWHQAGWSMSDDLKILEVTRCHSPHQLSGRFGSPVKEPGRHPIPMKRPVRCELVY